VAFVLAPSFDSVNSDDYTLNLVTFPDATTSTLTTLFSSQQISAIATEFPEEGPDLFEGSSLYQRLQVLAATVGPGGIAWEDDGKRLAFVAALDGVTADVYTIDPRDRSIRRLTTGLTQAAHLSWSPSGRYIINQGISDINIGRSGTDNVSGLWISTTDRISNRLAMPGPAYFLRWLDKDSFLAYYSEMGCGDYDLTLVDASTGERRLLWKGQFDAADADPVSRTVLVALTNADERLKDWDRCPLPPVEGLFIIRPPSSTPSQVDSPPGHDWIYELKWHPSSGTFVVGPSRPLFEVSPMGTVTDPSQRTPLPFQLSPSREYSWASDPFGHSPFGRGLSILAKDGSRIPVYDDYVCNMVWQPQSDTLFFYSDDASPVLFAASPPDFAPIRIVAGLPLSCSDPPQWIESTHQ